MARPSSSSRTHQTAQTGPAHDELNAHDHVVVRIGSIWAAGVVVAVLRVADQLFGVRYEVCYTSPHGGRSTRGKFNADQVRRPCGRSDGEAD